MGKRPSLASSALRRSAARLRPRAAVCVLYCVTGHTPGTPSTMHTASPQQALGFSRAHTVRRTGYRDRRSARTVVWPRRGGRLNVVLLIRITKRLVRWVAAVSAPIGPIRVSEPSAAASELPVSVSVRETRGRGTGKQTPNQQPRRSWARRRDAVVGPAVGGRTWHCRSPAPVRAPQPHAPRPAHKCAGGGTPLRPPHCHCTVY